MIKRLKKFITCFSILCLVQSQVYAAELTLTYDGKIHTYDKAPISLYVNNQIVESSIMAPVQIEGYVFVPIREVFDAMYATVQWKPSEQKVYIESEDNNSLMVLTLNSEEVWIDGEIKKIDMPPKVVNEKIMVPIRFISETLGYSVEWFNDTRTIYINKATNIINKEENTFNMYDNNTQIFSMLDYNEATGSIVLSEALGISVSHINVKERPMKRQLIFNINGGNLEQLIPGTWKGTLGHIKEITITKESNNAQICVTTDTVCAEQITSEAGKVNIQFVKPREKYDKIIVLDPGHGGDDSGTSYNNIYEKDLTLAYGNALYELLQQDVGIKVYSTRTEDLYGGNEGGIAGKQYPTLEMRVAMANEINPDLYISIHVNSYGEAPNGVETYYYEVASDTRGKTFASMVQKALVNEFAMNDRHIKTADYFVIKNTNDPAILIETGFITNIKDRKIITSETYPIRFANTVYNCILNYYVQGLNK